MLQVFLTTAERDHANPELKYVPGYNSYQSGITPPTHHIITRKYTKTHLQKPQPVNLYYIYY